MCQTASHKLRSLSRLLLAICAALLATAAGANTVRVDRLVFPTHVVITVNTVPVMGLVGGPTMTAQQRADVVLSRLSGWTAPGKSPKFVVRPVNGDYSIVVNGGVVVTPTSADARRAGMSRRQLTHNWAARLSSAWKTPYLGISPDGVVVGVGAARTLTVSGAARGPIAISVDAPQTVSAKEARPGVIQLTGLAPGRGSVTVTRGGASATAAFLVMKRAGSVAPVSVEVTGTAIPDDLLRDVVDSEVRRAIRLEPGAWFTAKAPPKYPAVWSRGNSLRYTMPVRIAGPNYLAVQTNVDIRIRRVSVPRPKDVTLFYSNNPETVRKPEPLFRHSLPDTSTAARLLYHHQNLGTQTLNLAVDITNTGTREAPVQVMDASAPPSMDTVLVGHRAAYQYLQRIKTDAGVIVRIPPGARRRIFARPLKAGDTMSGLMQFRALEKASLTLNMAAEAGNGAALATPEAFSDTVFPTPDKTLEATYTVGGQWAYVPIGRFPISNESGVRLDGNYGVLYTMRLKLINPTAKQATVRVVFEPRAGRAQAAFVIDGVLTETPSIYPPAEERVMTVVLAPHETRNVSMVTMPAAGGSYPAALIVRS